MSMIDSSKQRKKKPYKEQIGKKTVTYIEVDRF